MSTAYRAVHDRATLRRDLLALMEDPGWQAAGPFVQVLRRPQPAVRARVSLGAEAERVWRHLVVDVVTTMGGWNDAYRGGAVLGDAGDGVRRLVTRAGLPRPFLDREDDFEQHAFVEDGAFWELSRSSPVPTTLAPRHVAGRIWLAAKIIRPRAVDGGGCVVDILWQYQLGGVLDRLPWRLRARALADNLGHECERFVQHFGAGATA